MIGQVGRSRKRVLLIAVALGLAAAAMASYYMTRVSEAANPAEMVVIAKADIPSRVTVTEDMLGYKRVPKGAVHPEARSSMDPFIGKTTKQSITSGEQILTTKFFIQRIESGLAFVIPPGKRAVAVATDEHIGAGGLIASGDKIDIMGVCTISTPNNGGERSEITKTIFALQDIEVLAIAQKVVGEEAVSPLDSVKAPKKDDSMLSISRKASKETNAKTITLALTPGEAHSVVLLEENPLCNIRMALRSNGDDNKAATDEVTLDPTKPLPWQVLSR